MLTITCANNNISERKYIIDMIMKNFLDIDYKLVFCENFSVYRLEYNNKRIEFKDAFFDLYRIECSYLKAECLPKYPICYLDYSVLKKALPIIYGEDYLILNDSNIKCGLDIFSSSFFMLTRWEELIYPAKSNLKRIDESSLVSVINEFYNRPIVNEYCEFLVDLLDRIGFEYTTNRKFKVFLTHDVDWCYLSSFSELKKNLVKLWKTNSRAAIKTFCRYWYYRFFKKNPFDSFNEIMDISENNNFFDAFYFKATEKGENGHTYDISDLRVKKIIDNISKRGHEIGFHPSENTVDNFQQFYKEYMRLKGVYRGLIQGGRNHNLLYNKNTFEQWNNVGLKYDSGYGFQFRNGFRCGTCYMFQVFDVFKRCTLNVFEIPFIAMDSVAIRRKNSENEMYDEIISLIEMVKKYNGIACIIFHSNLMNTVGRKKFKRKYIALVNYLGSISKY